jgi:hypothetical protein
MAKRVQTPIALFFLLSLLRLQLELPMLLSRTMREKTTIISLPIQSNHTALIVSVFYIPEKARIEVHYTKGHPTFRGRLSGPALIALEEVERTANTWVADFRAPLSGLYGLELLLIYDDFPTQFRNTCIHHVYSNTIVLTDIEVTKGSSLPGYWKGNNSMPIITRFQPQGCRFKGIDLKLSHCLEPTSLERFSNYHWVWNQQPTVSRNTHSICLLGASHSRVLRETAVRFRYSIRHVEANFPTNITSKLIADNPTCETWIVAVGQWAAGWPENYPTLVVDFRRQMQDALHLLSRNKSHKVFCRSLHYNPLGDMITACPPTDWRNPTVMEAYNQVLREVCPRYLDSGFITGPVWDAAPDWCHPGFRVSVPELHYLLSQVQMS